jgi:hypothetical protein
VTPTVGIAPINCGAVGAVQPRSDHHSKIRLKLPGSAQYKKTDYVQISLIKAPIYLITSSFIYIVLVSHVALDTQDG